MEDFINSVRKLTTLLKKEKELLVRLERSRERGNPGRGRSAILDKVRKNIRNCSEGIVRELRNSTYSAQLLEHIKRIYAGHMQIYGFPWTCGMLSIKKEILSHFPLPCCLLSPFSFPASRLVECIMWEVETRVLIKIDCTYGIGDEFLTNSPSDKHHEGKIIAENFDRLDWGSQRALCDVCRRHKIPLIAIIQAKPKRNEFSSVADYKLDLEVGVKDRLYFVVLSHRDYRIFSEGVIESRELESDLMDKNNWVNGLFPFEELLSKIG